jgi:stress-induced morphogen
MTPEQMKDRLQKAYVGAEVSVLDMTGTHDHYEVVVESVAFEGLSRMQQHRSVMDVFDKELKSGEVHALTIRTVIPKK